MEESRKKAEVPIGILTDLKWNEWIIIKKKKNSGDWL